MSKDDFIGPKELQQNKKNSPEFIQNNTLNNAIYWTDGPTAIKREGESVILGEANCGIKLGRDSPKGSGTGTAAVGTINSSAIEIYVGKGTAVKDKQPKGYVDSNPYYDAAKIYISETTNIDADFNYRGIQLATAKYQSAIALSADQLRMFSRGHIILSTGMGNLPKEDASKDAEAPQQSARDSSGIWLVANNNTIDMQPLVKGDNLEQFCKKLINHIIVLKGIIQNFITYQTELNNYIGEHVHKSEFNAEDGYPSFGLKGTVEMVNKIIDQECTNKLKDHVMNINSLKTNYLKDGNPTYINSKYNKTN